MHELKLMDIQKKYKDKEAVRKFNYTFTNGVYGLLVLASGEIDHPESDRISPN